ncbi:hypothetical protein Tco_0781417 [Tanacetum coccineum]
MLSLCNYGLFVVWIFFSEFFGCCFQVVVEVLEPEPKLICSSGHIAEEQVQPNANIHCDDVVEDQNIPYPNIDKESLLAEVDDIKETGNVGFDNYSLDNMLESIYKNEQVDDKGEEGLVKQDDMLVMEENISGVKLDEQRAAQVEDVVSTFD